MTISEFASSRGISPQTVTMYITRHADLFDGHISKDGKNTVIDNEALTLLNKKYPDPVSLVEIRDTEETLQKLAEAEAKAEQFRLAFEKAQEELKQLYAAQAANATLVEEAKSQKLLLEDRSRELTETKEKNDRLSAEVMNQIQKTAEESKRADVAEVRLEQSEKSLAETVERLRAAEDEAASFTRSIFGLYRKKK